MNEKRLFIASCVALIATAMSFSIRGDILADFEMVHVRPFVENLHAASGTPAEVEPGQDPVKTRLGVIAGVAFFSFGLAILFGGPLCDLLGMGLLLRLAAACHIGGALLTIFAPTGAFYMVVAATLIVGAGNGLVEAVCNPLIATIYPEQKTQKLTLFHAWFPGGIVIGGLLCYALNYAGFGNGTELGWKIKMSLMLVPAVIYTVMILGQKFPPTERVASGVSFGEMVVECFRRPLFIVIFIAMWLTASTELGPGQWITNIFNEVMVDFAGAGILLLVWGNGLMYLLRQFASGMAHRLTPTVLMVCTAPLAALGLYLFSMAETPLMWFVAATFLFVGVCWWWPTMLGITSERFPKTGALGLAIIGGTGSFSTTLSGPVMGWINDTYGADRVLPIWALLPVAITVIFLLVVLADRARGGYRAQVERLHKGEGVAPATDPFERA